MTTIDTAREHAWYEQLGVEDRVAIGMAFRAAIKVLRDNNLEVAMDDRAEELVAAIAYYVRRSR